MAIVAEKFSNYLGMESRNDMGMGGCMDGQNSIYKTKDQREMLVGRFLVFGNKLFNKLIYKWNFSRLSLLE